MRVDQQLKSMAAEMLDLMYENEGVGLAANQVDLPIRMFVANPTGQRDDGEELVILNPEIDLPKGNEAAQEGCLSLPGVYGQVKRPKSVRLQGYDLKGNEIKRTLDGFLARVVQHEVDHLDGMMFFDRMDEVDIDEIQDAIDAFQSEFTAKRQTGEIPSDDELAGTRADWEKQYT